MQASRYQQLLSVAKWVLDPADPVNYAAVLETKDLASPEIVTLATGLGGASAQAYGQLIEGDQVVPNPYSRLLYNLAGIPFTTYTNTSNSIDDAFLHGLLLQNLLNPASTEPRHLGGERLRDDLAEFLASLSPAAGTVDLP